MAMKKGTDRQSLCAEAIIEGVEANLQNLMQVYDQLHYIDPRFAYDRMRFDRAGLEKAAAWIKDRIERTDEAEDIFYDWCFYSRDGIVAKAKNMTEPGARRRALEEYLAIPSAERPEATFRIECVVWEQYEYRLPDDAKEYETYEEARKALVDYLMIEKKQIAFVKTQWDVRSPVDVYGPTYFEDLHGDFYGDEKIFGGMWDALHVDDDIPIGIIEMKTTSINVTN